MPRGAAEVADVFRRYGQAYRQQRGDCLSTAQRRVMTAIERCRTAALGGHVEQCDTCGYQRISDNSCRNRHCPKCQSLARAQWLERSQPIERVINLINPVLRGWVNYFAVGHSSECFSFMTDDPSSSSCRTSMSSSRCRNRSPPSPFTTRHRSMTSFSSPRRNPADHRCRPRTSRRRARLLRGPPHLGADAAPSPAPALRCCGWRSLGRRQPLDRRPIDLLSASARARSALPSAVPCLSRERGAR